MATGRGGLGATVGCVASAPHLPVPSPPLPVHIHAGIIANKWGAFALMIVVALAGMPGPKQFRQAGI